MKVRVIPVSLHMITQFLRQGIENAHCPEMPADVKVVGFGRIFECPECICLEVESDSFEDVPEGSRIPEWLPIFTRGPRP